MSRHHRAPRPLGLTLLMLFAAACFAATGLAATGLAATRPATTGLAAATGPASSANSETAMPVTLDQIMQAVSTVRHVNARYVERRTLHILSKPIESRGTLRFDAPDQLQKKADPAAGGTGETPPAAGGTGESLTAAGGTGETLTINGDRLTIDRGAGTTPVVIALHQHPEIGVLAESLEATLSGDGAALTRMFEATPSGTLDHWQLVLQPREPAARKLLQWMRVIGYGVRITQIDTADNEGDRTEMSIVEQAK